MTAAEPIRNAPVAVYVPLRVRGSVRFSDGPAQRVAAAIGREPLRIQGAGELKALDLSVSVPEPAAVLQPPGARIWVGAAQTGRLPSGRAIARLAANRLLEAALAVQFQELLANPDASGGSRTSYRYVLANRPEAVAAADTGGGRDWVAPLAIGLGLAAVGVGGLVPWAHS